ncbi:MAG TPA: FKBP-type peptidyl-prolyl cis-trans isomerase [Candidatus Saccharimonadales bacterium]|nr:FKBP-type peptidyl-prolyl cis-trans isomerase [Candidatus Saccharimonadales bacterium]
MATKKSQRIGIWIIAIAMTVGTLGSFAAMILSTQNTAKDQQTAQKQYEEYKKQQEEAQKQATELSAKYYDSFKEYQSKPAAFDASSVGDKVTTNDIKVGDGEDVTADTKYLAYYIGWNPTGKVFDSSISGTSLKAPIDTSTTSLIEGWNQGVVGMKIGGVREITIPSALAYGEKGSGEDIPGNTPIKFVVMIVEKK